jgi:hypothetical protein
MSSLTLTTIDNVTRKTKHNLSAKAVYDQLSKKAADQGLTVKQLVAQLRILVTEYSKETMLLDKQLATGYFKLAAERETKVERWEFCKLENERLTFICSLYAQHYERLRTERESMSSTTVKKTVKNVKKVDTVEVVREIPDDWEDN